MGIVESGFGIADYHRERKDIEHLCIGYANARIETVLLVRCPHFPDEHPGHCLNFGEFTAQMRGNGLCSQVVALAADILNFSDDSVNAVALFVVLVKAKLITHIQYRQQHTRNTHSQSEDIQQGIKGVPIRRFLNPTVR